MKRAVLLVISLASVGLVVIGATITLARHLEAEKVSEAPCKTKVGTEEIHISSSGFKPANLSVKLCTDVVFISDDSHPHLPAYGEYDHHLDPSGFSEKILISPGDSNGVTINQPGNWPFHDHLNQDLTGNLTVTP